MTTEKQTQPPQDETERPVRSVRQAVAMMWKIATLSRNWFLDNSTHLYGKTSLRSFKALIEYADAVPDTKRKTSMDVQKAIKDWTDWIAVYATAHSKADIDRIEFSIDDLLRPILTAPVKQIRSFWLGLVDALEADPRIPFFVWSFFSAWGKIVVDVAEDREAVMRLKKKLATEVADLTMEDERVYIDFHQALIGALQWRDPETLKEIKSDLKAGARPKIKGRQSCLFLSTKRRGRNAKEHLVML